jgi:hypothetical protein
MKGQLENRLREVQSKIDHMSYSLMTRDELLALHEYVTTGVADWSRLERLTSSKMNGLPKIKKPEVQSTETAPVSAAGKNPRQRLGA